MNYGVLGSVSGNLKDRNENESAVKRFLSENRWELMSKNNSSNLKYLD